MLVKPSSNFYGLAMPCLGVKSVFEDVAFMLRRDADCEVCSPVLAEIDIGRGLTFGDVSDLSGDDLAAVDKTMGFGVGFGVEGVVCP